MNSPAPDLKYWRLFAARRRAQKAYRRSRKAEDRTVHNRINAALRRHSKRLQKQSFVNFVTNVNAHTPSRAIWSTVHALSGDRGPGQPFACLALSLSKTMPEVAELFADIFEPPYSPPPEAPCNNPLTGSAMDDPFTQEELERALLRLKRRSAPGPDSVTNQALRNLPTKATTALLAWFNDIWASGNVPREWKEAWIIPIYKNGKPRGSLSAYRPVSLTSCVAKLMERLVQYRIVWHLEELGHLPCNMTGLRPRLCALDSVLDFVSDIEHQAKCGGNSLAVFLDIEKAFDNVSLSAVLRGLQRVGISGRINLFLESFLTNRTFRVKLGKTLSGDRPFTRGLPQGSVLSPILFNLVMSDLATNHAAVNMTIYADDLCLWTTASWVSTLEGYMQAALNNVEQHLKNIGLHLSANKTKYMAFHNIGRRRLADADLYVGGCLIERVRTQRFLGVTVDQGRNWGAQVRASIAACRSPANAIRHLASTHWGTSPRALLQMHQALIMSRILYAAPFIDAAPSNMRMLDRIHRAGIKHALGVPKGTNTILVHRESGVLPLESLSRITLDNQLIRLHTTITGVDILLKMDKRKQSRLVARLASLPERASTCPTANRCYYPPWRLVGPRCYPRLPGVRKKRDLSDVVMRSIVLSELEEKYSGALQIYTDGSVHMDRASSAAGFTVPSMGIDWRGRLLRSSSSLAAELVAIKEAVSFAETVFFTTRYAPVRHPLVILTDSRSAVQKLARVRFDDNETLEIRNMVYRLTELGHTVSIQWVPSHSGIPGNERADALAELGHESQPTVLTMLDPRLPYKQAKEAAYQDLGEAAPNPFPCVTRGLPRGAATLLFRFRTGTARSREWLFMYGLADSALCPTCRVIETVKHLLDTCSDFNTERSDLLAAPALANLGITRPSACIFPTGDARQRRAVQNLFLDFLSETALAARL